jgi:hypothetical protein
MQRAGNILKKFIRDYGLEAGLKLPGIRRLWASLVGQPIATHSFPDTVSGTTLFVIVDTPQWMHHLSFYKHEIIEKLSSHDIKDIRFKIGKLPPPTDGTIEVVDSHLTEEDAEYIRNTVEIIKDKDLKKKFRSWLTRSLSRKRK